MEFKNPNTAGTRATLDAIASHTPCSTAACRAKPTKKEKSMKKKLTDNEKALHEACRDLNGAIYVNLVMACHGHADAEGLRALKIDHAKSILSQAEGAKK